MPDYMFLLESRLMPDQRELLARVQELARNLQVNIYLTGGAVRDLITGMPIRDLDLTLEGHPARLARELEKTGSRVREENERLRHIEMVTPEGTEFSLAAARDEVYARPGAKPETRWATIMEDLRRRDFSINAIALSLNPASRGLVLDPTNGLADLEKREVRALTMHSFTNQPIRLLRVLRFCARMDFKMEARTADWFALALERGLQESFDGEAVGEEIRQLAREEKIIQALKAWENRELIGVIHPRLAKRHPDYDGLMRMLRVREMMLAARVTPRLFPLAVHYLLVRLSPGERGASLRRMELRPAEIDSVQHIEHEAQKVAKMLKGRKTALPKDAYYYLESAPPHLLAFILIEFSQARVVSKVRAYLAKWRPLRLSLPVGELEALGVARGPKFDHILQELFHLQLVGKGRNPQDRVRLLRQLAGIKPEPKKKEKEKEVKKKGKKPVAEVHPAVSAAKAKGKRPRAASAEVETESEEVTLDSDLHLGLDEEELPLPVRAIAGEEEGEEAVPTTSKGRAAMPSPKPSKGHPAVRSEKAKGGAKAKPKRRVAHKAKKRR